jgi:hypothetical protein
MWYERRALILEKYAVRDDEMKWAENALVACVEALEDDDTHISESASCPRGYMTDVYSLSPQT